MKKIITFFITIVFANNIAQAQLLNKLKQKAQQALEEIPTQNSSDEKEKKSTEEDKDENNSNNNNTNASIKSPSKPTWMPTANDEKVFTLEEGERIMYDENKIYASQGKINYSIILSTKDYKYVLIENGVRKGPYNTNPYKEAGIKILTDKKNYDTDENEANDGSIELGQKSNDKITLQYTKTINNKLHIVFNGKTFGPYDYICKIIPSQDNKKFWAVVTIGGESSMTAQMGMGNNFLINESGVKQKLGNQEVLPYKLMVSEHDKAAMVMLINATSQSAMCLSSSGKKQEGTMMMLNNEGILYVADNGDIVSVPSQSPTQVLVNGNEVASFSTPIENKNNLIITENYKNLLYYKSGKLYKADGSTESISGVLFPKHVRINNQDYISYFRILKNENGQKDVYLCKKQL